MQQDPRTEYGTSYVDVLGARMHYLHAGAGRPMILIHGLVGSSANWWRNIGALASDASVYAIDQVNAGQSDRIAGLDPSLEAAADRVAATMTALGLSDADIAGHSHGGAVAMMLAARHPERVRSLILFAPANPYSTLSDFLVRFYGTWFGYLVATTAPYVPSPMQHFALGRMYGDPARIPDGSLEGYVNDLRRPGTVQHVLAIVRSWFTDMERLKAALSTIPAVPMLLLWGDCDRAVSLESGRRLNRQLPASELVVVAGGGHVLFEEMPEESNRVMLDWLRRDLPSTQSPVESTKPAARARSVAGAASRSAGTTSGLRRVPTGS